LNYRGVTSYLMATELQGEQEQNCGTRSAHVLSAGV